MRTEQQAKPLSANGPYLAATEAAKELGVSVPTLYASRGSIRADVGGRQRRRRRYMLNGGTLEHAQQIAAHQSPRTTKLYDRTKDEISLDEVERIKF